jgi:hypothetical protein
VCFNLGVSLRRSLNKTLMHAVISLKDRATCTYAMEGLSLGLGLFLSPLCSHTAAFA